MTLRELQTIYRENCIHDGLLYDHQPRPGVHEAHLNALAAVQRAVESSCGEADQRDAARWRWLCSRINYRDETRRFATNETAPILETKVRVWSHETHDRVSDSITVSVDAAMSAQYDKEERK